VEDTVTSFVTLDEYRDSLAKALGADAGPNIPETLPISPWLAMSLMQKAIRRGRVGLALRAGATLLATSPERLWRRLGITAFEDIGVADLNVVGLVTAGLTGRVWRSKVGGEWHVASYLIAQLATAPKCRSVTDLVGVVEADPSLSSARNALSCLPLPDQLTFAFSDAPLDERAIALWYAFGTQRCRSRSLQSVRGDREVTFDWMRHALPQQPIVELAFEGLKKSGEAICLLLPLIWQEFGHSAGNVEPDTFPPEELIGSVPCWAFDMYVREGKHALGRFLNSSAETARWVHGSIPARQRAYVLGCMLYSIEGGLLDHRLAWDVGRLLRERVDREMYGVSPDEVAGALNQLRVDLPKLNQERRNAASSNSR
jgi:hypothetical protein